MTSIYDGSSTSALLTGMMWLAAYDECPQAEYTGIALEYGTLPVLDVMDALRADQWLENHPEADRTAQSTAIKQQLRDAFYTDTDVWKEQPRRAGVGGGLQALEGLTALGDRDPLDSALRQPRKQAGRRSVQPARCRPRPAAAAGRCAAPCRVRRPTGRSC